MVLVDTSVWVDHLREGNADLIQLLSNGQVACHQFIIGELACGNLKNRVEILTLLQSLPIVAVAEHAEIMQFVEDHKLMSSGIGYIDIHLLASAILAEIPFWTFDKKLNEVSSLFNMAFKIEENR